MAGQPMLSGIHRSLKDTDTPWQDKVKLAKFAWCSSQCFLPNKQQVLLDWVCNALANQTKFSIPNDMVSTLWQYLHDILDSKQIAQESLTIRDTLYPVVCASLKFDSNHVTMATGCLHIILQSSSLCRSLSSKYDVMVDLLSALMQLVTRCLETSKSIKGNAVASLHILMKKFTAIHRQRQLQANKKAYAAMYERLLVPALGLYSCNQACDQTGIKTQIQDLISMAVFNKDMCEVYTKYLTLDREALEAKDIHLLAHFKDVDKMMEHLQEAVRLKNEKGYKNYTCAGLPVLYTTFIASYKPSAEVKFAMFKKLCGIMGISPVMKDSGMDSKSHCDWKQTLPALDQMLRTVHNNDTYVVAIDNAEDQPKFQWFHKLLQLLLIQADRSSVSFFKCIHILLELNHVIIEEELTQVWNVSLLTPSHIPEADTTVEESRTVFLGGLMQTYVKLRQFDKLLECMLASFQLNSESEVSVDSVVYFNPGFIHRFCQCIQELPPGLTLDLWKLFKDDLVNSYISKLLEEPNSEPPKKKRKSITKPDRVMLSALEKVAVTFHLFLTSAQLVDTSVTKVMMNRIETLVEETQEDVLKVLHVLCQSAKDKVNEHLLFSTLLLTYTMGELQLILLQHAKYGSHSSKFGSPNSKYGSGEPADDDKSEPALTILRQAPCTGDLLPVKPGSKVKDVLGRYEKHVGHGHVRLTHLMHQLRTQQMRVMLLYTPEAIDDSMSALLQTHCDGVLSCDVTIDNDIMQASWDGQISSITNENYPIAYLHMLTQTLPIWLPYASNHSQQVASLLVQSFNADFQEGCNGMTLSSVAKSFLSSDVCMESKELQTALLGASLKHVAKLCTTSSKTSISLTVRCGQLLDMLTEGSDDKERNWEIMEDVGQQLSSILTDDDLGNQEKKMTKQQDLARNVCNILRVLDQLPLTYLLPSNQERCLLGLVIIDIMIAKWMASKLRVCSKQLLETLGYCRGLEIKILKSMKSTGLLKCLPVGSVLAHIITSHTQTWRDGLKAPSLDEWRNGYVGLDGVTQQLITQWLQKSADRVSQEGSVLVDVAKMVKNNLVELMAEVASTEEKISFDSLHQCIPILSASVTVIQRSIISYSLTKESESGTSVKAMKKLSQCLQDHLKRTRFNTEDEMDGMLVACLAKCAMALMEFEKVTNQDSADTPETSSVAMETDDVSEMTSLKKSEVSPTKDEVNRGFSELYQDLLYPILVCVLRLMERTKQLGSLLASHDGAGGFDARIAHSIEDCLTYVSAVCEFGALHGELVDEDTIWAVLKQILTAMSNDQTKDKAMASISSVLIAMTKDQFQEVLEQNVLQLGTAEVRPNSVASLQACVLTWQVMPNCQLSEEKHKILQALVPKVLVCLHCLMVEAARDWAISGSLVVAILQTMAAIMASHKKLLHPKQAMQTLQACLAVQFTTVPDGLFVAVFGTMYLLHKSLLQAFPQAVMNCIAAYLVSVQHMLRGIMRRSHQGLSRDESLGDQELFGCAENMERLLTQLSCHEKQVGRFVILLISEYISELQKGTLYPFVKKALVVGLYNLVDVCDEKALALMQATLPLNVKEIYTEFYSDYKKYHKYKGKV